MIFPRGIRLLVVLLLAVWAWRATKLWPLSGGGSPPSPSTAAPVVFVYLGAGFPQSGVHQFYDGIAPGSVIQMTLPGVSFDSFPPSLLSLPLTSGETLDIAWNGGQVIEIKRSWMPAAMRMALFIPLHPDRMNAEDWDALPGIGREIARRIEEERQKNGDFGSLAALRRVRGVGEKLINRLSPYF